MQQKTLLICDDDQAILDVLELVLKPYFNVISEIDSLQVPALVRFHHPDLLLVDLWMPFLSGDQLIRLLRRDKETRHLPIIAISASQTGKKVALGAGADSFIPKPFDMDELVNEVRAMLEPGVVRS